MRSGTLRVAVALSVTIVLAVVAPGNAAPAAVRIDLTARSGDVPPGLLGVSQPPLSAAVAATLAERVPALAWMRVDAYLDQAVTTDASGLRYDFRALDQRLAAASASGAAPLLILSYLPPELADPACAQRARFYPGVNRCPPADPATWSAVVRRAVEHACCETNTVTEHLNRTRWFEVWNEPDLPSFFAGTLADYLDLYAASDAGLRAVEHTHAGLDLHLGGPALLEADPVWITGLSARVAADGLDLDFVSWHHYADYPFFGPLDGAPATPPLDNPALSAGTYAEETHLVRDLLAPYAKAGLHPQLWLDEWNIDAGVDPQHGTDYGMAFTAAVLHAMADAGLDRSARFNTQDDGNPLHTWGLFRVDGTPKPAFDAYRLWGRLEPVRVAATTDQAPGPDSSYRQGVIATRSADGRRATVLLHNFTPTGAASPWQVAVTVAGASGRAPYAVTVAGGGHTATRRGTATLPGTIAVTLPPQGIALLELDLTDRPAGAPR